MKLSLFPLPQIKWNFSPPFFSGWVGIFLLASTPQAALDFDTYRIRENRVSVGSGNGQHDSVEISYELTALGSVSLEASSIGITSHGSYLDIVEEATLTGNVETKYADITQDFLMQGTLPIPNGAAVKALQVFHGDTLFSSHLYKSIYSLNDVFLDSALLKTSLNQRVAFLQQISDQVFEATFAKLELGEPVRIKIFYELPMPGSPETPIDIPILFHPTGRQPRQLQIQFFETRNDLPPLQWQSPSGLVNLNSDGSHTVAYSSHYSFKRAELKEATSTLQASTFESGLFQGSYLLFKAGLNDSLMTLLSQPMETFFLWRWNGNLNLVEYVNGLKALSPLGKRAVAEAKLMLKIMHELLPRGHRFGLLQSVEDQDNTLFPLAGKEDEGAKKLMDYLESFTEKAIYEKYNDIKTAAPIWAPTDQRDDQKLEQSRAAFFATLRKLKAGFNSDKKNLSHIVILGIGEVTSHTDDLNDPEKLDTLLDNTTLYSAEAQWPGIDLATITKTKNSIALQPIVFSNNGSVTPFPVYFPIFQPTTIEYRVFTQDRNQAVVMPFDVAAVRMALIKSQTPFQDSLQLQGIDVEGNKTRILSIKPRFTTTNRDTGLARIWAADVERIYELSESSLGMKYGILTKGSYFSASISDGKLTAQPGNSQGVAIRTLPKTGRWAKKSEIKIQDGFIWVDAKPGGWTTLEIFDVMGHRLLKVDLSLYRNGNTYRLPLTLLKGIHATRIILVLQGKPGHSSLLLPLGAQS